MRQSACTIRNGTSRILFIPQIRRVHLITFLVVIFILQFFVFHYINYVISHYIILLYLMENFY